MSKIGFDFLDGSVFSRQIRRWAQAARKARFADLSSLQRQDKHARALRAHLDQLIHIAGERLALPVVGSSAFPKPHNADWDWRPDLWRGPLATPGIASVQTKSKLGEEVTLFHDCRLSEITLRQIRNLRSQDLAPYGLQLDVFRFDGSFLSLVLDLPEPAVTNLKRTHILKMDVKVEMERPIEIFARLNIKNGPNTEQVIRELPQHDENISVEFDLAYTALNEKRVERAWIDVIFEGPEMNQVILRDCTFTRRPRANL